MLSSWFRRRLTLTSTILAASGIALVASGLLGAADSDETPPEVRGSASKPSTNNRVSDVTSPKNRTVWDVSDRKKPWTLRRPDPNRNLELDELANLLRASELLISKESNDLEARRRAVSEMAAKPHKHAIPVLLAVIHDEQDDLKLRRACVGALGEIRHRLVIQHLIKLIDNENLGYLAHDALIDIAGLNEKELAKQLDPDMGRPTPKQKNEFWNKWWSEHPSNQSHN